MGFWTWFSGILGISTVVGVAILAKYTGLGEFFGWIWSGISKLIDWLNHYMPKAIKPYFFLLFVLIFSSAIIGTMLNIHFSCTTNDEIRVAKVPVIGGLGIFINQFLVTWDKEKGTSEYNCTYDDYILNETESYGESSLAFEEGTPESFIRIKCEGQRPHIYFWNIDLFNYRIWVLMFILAILLKFFMFFISQIRMQII